MPDPSERKRIHISAPPEYEMKLLTALAFFLGRKVSTQAAAALAMYIRQSHDRIMAQVNYYAHRCNIEPYDLLDLIYDDPEKAKNLLDNVGKVHAGEELKDVFFNEDEAEDAKR